MANNNFELKAIRSELENCQTEQLQDEMREEAKQTAKRNEFRLNEIYSEQKKLREKLIDTNEFIQECRRKEINADKNVQAEIQLQNEIKCEIEKITKDTEILETFHSTLQDAVDDLKPYKSVLDQVSTESELFKDTRDLIDRCDTLCELLLIFYI